MGLIDKSMAAPPGAEPALPPGAEADDGDFTPEQDAALKKFSLAVEHALYSGETAQKMAEAIAGADDKPKAISDFAYNLTAMVDEKSQGMLDDELIAPAAADVLGQVLEVAEAAGVQVGEVEMSKAVQLLLARYFEEIGATPEEVAQFMGAVDPALVGGAVRKGVDATEAPQPGPPGVAA